MKKYICNPLWLLLLFVAFISSCDKEEIVFDHELPQFELRSDAILLEVIMPQGTGADEIIYIAGDFNGGQDAAFGDLKWQMEKAANNDVNGAYTSIRKILLMERHLPMAFISFLRHKV